MIQKLKAKFEENGPMDEAFWNELLEKHKIITVNKNEILVRFNSLSRDYYFILKGSFVSSQISESGAQKSIWFHFDEFFEFMGCPDSLFMDEPTKYQLKAMEDSMVLKLSKPVVDHWVKHNSYFNQLYLQNFVNDFVTIYEARSCLLTFTSLEFLKYTQEKFPYLLEKLPSYHIADFMGISPEWYSKLKKKLAS